MSTLLDRQSATLDFMASKGLSTLILAANGLNLIDAPNPVLHLTGFVSYAPALAIIRRDGGIRILTVTENDARNPVDGITITRTNNLPKALHEAVAGSPRLNGVVGIDDLPASLGLAVETALSVALTPCDGDFFAATATKTADELLNATRAVEIAESGFRELLALAKPGLRECDLANSVNAHMRALGADNSFLMLSARPENPAIMPSSERRLASGDVILVELSPSVGGQFVQICRTVILGSAKPMIESRYGLLVESLTAGIAAVRKGNRVADICMAINHHMAEAGFDEFSRPPHIKRRGHGLGGGSIFPGDVEPENQTVLENDMLFVVHPNQFLPDAGYMMCGETVRVTDNGCEILGHEHARLFFADATC